MFVSEQTKQVSFQEKKAPSDDFWSHAPRPPHRTLSRAYLASKGLDLLSMAVLAISNEGVNLSIGDLEIGALRLGQA